MALRLRPSTAPASPRPCGPLHRHPPSKGGAATIFTSADLATGRSLDCKRSEPRRQKSRLLTPLCLCGSFLIFPTSCLALLDIGTEDDRRPRRRRRHQDSMQYARLHHQTQQHYRHRQNHCRGAFIEIIPERLKRERRKREWKPGLLCVLPAVVLILIRGIRSLHTRLLGRRVGIIIAIAPDEITAM